MASSSSTTRTRASERSALIALNRTSSRGPRLTADSVIVLSTAPRPARHTRNARRVPERRRAGSGWSDGGCPGHGGRSVGRSLDWGVASRHDGGGSGHVILERTPEPVQLELAVERLAIESQKARGGRLVAAHLAQRLQDMLALHLGKRTRT